MEKTTKYIDLSPLGKCRRILVFLADFFIAFILGLGFFFFFFLPHTDIGDKLGWDLDNRMEIHISAQVTENGEPCLVIGHDNPPKYLGDY